MILSSGIASFRVVTTVGLALGVLLGISDDVEEDDKVGRADGFRDSVEDGFEDRVSDGSDEGFSDGNIDGFKEGLLVG